MSHILNAAAVIGMILGGVDYLFFSSRIGIGKEFKRGIECIAPLTINMAGILVLSPVIVSILEPFTASAAVFRLLDPSIIGALFSTDMGGYEVASSLANDREVGIFISVILTSMFGGTFSYIIPVGSSLISQDDYPLFFKGLVIGLIVLPFTGFITGLGMNLSPFESFVSLLPILLLSGVIIILMKVKQSLLLAFFSALSKAIKIIAICGLIIGSIELVAGYRLFDSQMSFMEAMVVPVRIASTLMGLMPILWILTPLTQKLFTPVVRKLGMTSSVVDCMLLSTLTAAPVFLCFEKMNQKDKVVTMAWMVGAMGVFSSHYAYILASEPSAVGSLVISKLMTGLAAALIAISSFRASKSESRVQNPLG